MVKSTNSGAAYIFDRNNGGTNKWQEVEKIIASDGEDRDQFGNSVAISGNVVVVGASGNDTLGSAYIYERNNVGNNNWGQVKRLLPSDTTPDQYFGSSVAISGNTVVVGANEDNYNGSLSGSAYIFERNNKGNNRWGQFKKLLASDGAEYDEFGRSVAISGNTVVVGAEQDDDNDRNSGSAYVFE